MWREWKHNSDLLSVRVMKWTKLGGHFALSFLSLSFCLHAYYSIALRKIESYYAWKKERKRKCSLRAERNRPVICGENKNQFWHSPPPFPLGYGILLGFFSGSVVVLSGGYYRSSCILFPTVFPSVSLLVCPANQVFCAPRSWGGRTRDGQTAALK